MSAEPRVLSGRYQVGELIGQGGMARVYRGTDLTLGRTVAIKILNPELARDTAFRTRFRLEAQAASRMAHPSIVRVFDAGEESETDAQGTHAVPYIVMELVDGEQLKDVIARGPVDVATTVKYVDGILEALEYSHRAGVVHRDIKPGNVMITTGDKVKVMDFGIARAVSDSSSTVAETTQIIGTAAYFSPEQAKGEQVDARADLYSTGVVLYELLTGRQPFRGDSPVAVAYQHVSEAPEPPSEVTDKAPRSMDAIVLRALAKDPFQRFQDAATFRAALDAAVTGKAPTKKQLGELTSELYGPSPRQAAETARSLRQLSSDTTMVRTQSGPPVAWIWAGVALLAVLLASVLIWVVTMRPANDLPTSSRTVPLLTGMTYERAEAELEKHDLKAARLNESNAEVAEGNVIRSSPSADARLEAGQTVTLFVSTGAEMVKVPVLVGLSQEAAKAALEAAGLVVGSVKPVNDIQAAAGTVLSASVEAGGEVAPGTVVALDVASGVVSLKDLKGYPLEAAQQELEALGLTGNPVEDPNCKATDPRTVISMSSAPGDVPVRSTIDLRFCAGS
ncbi:serine/threonine-protein kinase [Microbacterium keratanolyticum]|uniref:non-specific serine/threonine protein kinase n=1 Tax=Microbacterium keratanolyticum TaxID=67574 RepID=A0A9W6HQW8_9MICO|nr:Stk1 family PASTA domain-containing Ser/Thr kinase [Microbacterium keratanolyticum]MBM7468782.1 serine/threonine-protein kinase [Microbacterium keratanolyticum]GLK00858.1 putative serine/threonine-protein kinase PknB [Microbacterium keratanolyticum]